MAKKEGAEDVGGGKRRDRDGDEGSEGRHPIRVVAERTGLTPDLIRAWENRYGVVEPFRTESGHRLYSDEQVERLRVLRRVTLGGRSIGQVAELSTSELGELAREDEAGRAKAPRAPEEDDSRPDPPELVGDALTAVRELDPEALDAVLRRSALALGTSTFLREVAAPLFRIVGDLWHDGELRPAQEHLASAGVRRVLDWLARSTRSRAPRPRLILATPAGERHEMGALLAAAAAEAQGWEVIYLGPDLPADDIAFAAIRTGARAVGLSAVYAPELDALEAEVKELRERLPPQTLLLAGGAAIQECRERLEEAKVVCLDEVTDLGRILQSLSGTEK
jgi:MerR family transcriptional regulator, light-induced transcriptional regulator